MFIQPILYSSKQNLTKGTRTKFECIYSYKHSENYCRVGLILNRLLSVTRGLQLSKNAKYRRSTQQESIVFRTGL